MQPNSQFSSNQLSPNMIGMIFSQEQEVGNSPTGPQCYDPASIEHFQKAMEKPHEGQPNEISQLIENAKNDPNNTANMLRMQLALGEQGLRMTVITKVAGNVLNGIQSVLNNQL